MYCVDCGSSNPDHGKFCHNCGNRLVNPTADVISQRLLTEKEILSQILRMDPKPNQCHRCGSHEEDLIRREFGIAKVISVKRDWSETVARAGISVVSIAAAPLIGFGGFSWKNPSKTTSLQLIKVELVLCHKCLSWAWTTRFGTKLKEEAYRFHPWAKEARTIGYDKYLSSEELKTLKPIK